MHLKYAIMRALASGKALSKSDLAQRTNFRIPSISKVLSLWLEQGLLVHIASERGTWGKHSGCFALNPDCQTSLMLNIRPDYLEAGFCDILGAGKHEGNSAMCSYHRRELPLRNSPLSHPEFLWKEIQSVMSHFSVSLESSDSLGISQICVASHGTIIGPTSSSATSGAEIMLPHLGWKSSLGIQNLLEKHYQLPATVESDCITASYNMLERDSCGDFIFLHLGYGIAASVVWGYRVLGAQHSMLTPGQIGHSPVTDQGRRCKCGNYGCLETVATPEAILREVEQELQKNSVSSLSAICEQELTFADVVAAVEEGDALAQRICSNAIHYISLSLVRMIHLLNPPKIYLWGELTKLGEFLLSNLYAGISHSSIYQERENTVLEIVRFEGNAVFQGLARMKLYQEYIG